ncbi:fluoride efflux transporter FluC [Geodermatophilus sp. SYSU D00815]
MDGERSGRGRERAVVAAVAVGGVLGAEARYALDRWAGAPVGAWPWATWWINVGGSFLLGVLVAVLTALPRPHRLARPFLGTGVLGGFTTFSTAMVQVPELARAGRPVAAAGYLVGTALAAVLAAALGLGLVRAAVRRRAR